MGSFANTIFSVLLGWVRSAVNWVWQLAVSQEGSGVIEWLASNWLILALCLCGAGMVIDMVVHIFRWRPYKVWASFFRRMFGRREAEEPELPPQPPRGRHTPRRQAVQRQWLYADGTAYPEQDAPPEQMPVKEDAPPAPSVSSEEQYRLKFARPGGKDSLPPLLRYQEELDRELPVKGLEDYPQPKVITVDAAAETPSQTGRQSKRLTRVSARHFFDKDEDELDLRYRPAPPAVDKREAYGQPYYPPQWRKPADVGASRKEETSEADSPV